MAAVSVRECWSRQNNFSASVVGRLDGDRDTSSRSRSTPPIRAAQHAPGRVPARGVVAQWGFLVRGASVCDLLLTEKYVDSAVPKVDSN